MSRIREAQAAFDTYKVLCFFDTRDDFVVTEDTIDFVTRRLKQDGNMRTFRLATRIEQGAGPLCR